MYQDLKVEYRLTYKSEDKRVTKIFKSFSQAAGAASALNGIVRMIHAKFFNHEYSHSGTVFIYSKNNTRRVGSPFIYRLVVSKNNNKKAV